MIKWYKHYLHANKVVNDMRLSLRGEVVCVRYVSSSGDSVSLFTSQNKWEHLNNKDVLVALTSVSIKE